MNEKQLRAELDAVYGSLSWRITAPLRHLSAFVRRFVLRPLSPRFWMHIAVNFIIARPALVALAKKIVGGNPKLKQWAQRFTHSAIQVQQQEYLPPNLEIHEENKLPMMSTHSCLIYLDLQRAIEERK